jgi:hypothetical protein
MPNPLRTKESGFFFVIVAALLFFAMAAGLSLLAAYTIDQTQRQGATGSLEETVYRGIVGNPSVDGNFGYLGDVGDYPASLADLMVLPASNPAGWNGPYLQNVPVSGGIVYDSFGSPLEYFTSLVAGTSDMIAVVSKGPDHGSTNTAANPNVAAQFAGISPSSAGYSAGSSNSDNVPFPNFVANSASLNYQNVGTLTYNIQNFNRDPAQSAQVAGCPGLYKVNVTSATRGASDTISLQYSPNLADDFVQGNYDVSITANNSVGAVWNERVGIAASSTVNRTVVAMPYDTTATTSFTLTVYNESTPGVTMSVRTWTAGGGSLGTVTVGTPIKTFTVNACTTIVITQGATVYDTFVMPYANYTRYVQNPVPPVGPYTLTVTNGGTNTNQLQVIQANGLLLGTVYKRKTKTFSVPANPAPNPGQVAGTPINFVKQNGVTIISSSTITANTTLTIP